MDSVAIWEDLKKVLIGATIAFDIAATPSPFDVPLGTVSLPAKSMADPQGGMRCTFFADLVVRENDFDMLPPGAVSLLPPIPEPSAAACRGAPTKGAHKLDAEGFALVGRLQHFLLFDYPASASGALTIRLFDIRSSAVVWQDDTSGENFSTLATTPDGGLRFGYRHAAIAHCSLLTDPWGCWQHLATRGLLPMTIASQPPPSCEANYRREMAPADNTKHCDLGDVRASRLQRTCHWACRRRSCLPADAVGRG
jgi:hypothetical protein